MYSRNFASSIKVLGICLQSTNRHVCTTISSCQSTKEGWFNKMMSSKDPVKESHSSLLSEKGSLFELTTHNIIPDRMDDYISHYQQFVECANAKGNLDAKLLASWIVGVGDQDQCLHLWKYSKGYEGIDSDAKIKREDKDYIALRKARTPFLRSRRCQYLLSFSYWPQIVERSSSNLYEIRSYILKPGTVIEWGNNWVRGIHQRKDEAYAGFFSQIGILYNVHHIWVYPSLLARKQSREQAWRKPGWDECVAHTVPLIKEMESRILLPTPFSPTK